MPKKDSTPPSPGTFNLKDFTPKQNQALLDLLVLAMYTDGFLAKVEEARVQFLLNSMGFTTDYDRNREFDASVTRVRKARTPDDAKKLISTLAANFTAREHQERVFNLLSDLTAVDGRVSSEESKFLAAIKETFKM